MFMFKIFLITCISDGQTYYWPIFYIDELSFLTKDLVQVNSFLLYFDQLSLTYKYFIQAGGRGRKDIFFRLLFKNKRLS